MNQRKEKNWNILLVGKYLFSVIITILAIRNISNWRYLLIGLLELGSIISISYWVLGKNKVIGHIIHFVQMELE